MNTFPLPQRVPLTDPKTGVITREWALFFEKRFGPAGTGEQTLLIQQLIGVEPLASPAIDGAIAALEKRLAAEPYPAQQSFIQEPDLSTPAILEQIEALKKRVTQLEQGVAP